MGWREAQSWGRESRTLDVEVSFSHWKPKRDNLGETIYTRASTWTAWAAINLPSIDADEVYIVGQSREVKSRLIVRYDERLFPAGVTGSTTGERVTVTYPEGTDEILDRLEIIGRKRFMSVETLGVRQEAPA